MSKGTIWALIITAVLMFAVAIICAAFSFFMWALSLNGYVGQESAVNTSLITFVVLASITSLACIALSLVLVYFLAAKKKWDAAGSAVLSTVLFAALTAGGQILSIIISVIVADQMRTTR